MWSLIWKAISASGGLALEKRRQLGFRRQALRQFIDQGRTIEFPRAENPKCTIIIPVYNGAEHTLQCLLSLQAIAADWMEILVFDDCSSDETSILLSRFQNLRVVRAEKNAGFLTAVNSGAKAARGAFLILLNNDARFLEGSILDAIKHFEAERSIGYMGARIVLATGELQEAGCITYQTGNTHGYLRFSPKNDLRALFMRDVDYCSAVFCIVRRQQFLDMGGFDLEYAPAYYEETDFCMRLRAQGFRCIYNPAVLVEHFEFGSQPTYSAHQQKAMRKAVFLERWHQTLVRDGFPVSQLTADRDIAARRLQPRPRRIIAVHAHEIKLQSFEKHLKSTGTNVIHIVGLSASEAMKLREIFGPYTEISVSKSLRGLKQILAENPGFFDEKYGWGTLQGKI